MKKKKLPILYKHDYNTFTDAAFKYGAFLLYSKPFLMQSALHLQIFWIRTEAQTPHVICWGNRHLFIQTVNSCQLVRFNYDLNALHK